MSDEIKRLQASINELAKKFEERTSPKARSEDFTHSLVNGSRKEFKAAVKEAMIEGFPASFIDSVERLWGVDLSNHAKQGDFRAVYHKSRKLHADKDRVWWIILSAIIVGAGTHFIRSYMGW